MSDSKSPSSPAKLLLLADHLTLNLLNTEARTGAQHTDFLRNGDDVSRWL